MKKSLIAFIAMVAFTSTTFALTATVSFVKLTGVTGGSPAETAVWYADLSGLGLTSLQSITIRDNSSGLGGASGQFSGFDLDGVKLSTTLAVNAAAASLLPGLSVFDFSPSSTFFTPGTQRPVADPKLFGTDATGTKVDNSVATLGSFDGDSSTTFPDGFLSMGDNGRISFNLSSTVSTSGLYLYIGEVGDNGELAAGAVEVSDQRVSVPDHGSTALLLYGTLGLLAFTRRFLKQ